MRILSGAWLVVALSITSVLRGQSTSASLTGRVTDASKAAIAGASITAISASTNREYRATSDDSGEYTLSNLPPASYRLEVEKIGFKKLVKPDVTLHVLDALEISFELPVGPVTESITVQGGAPLLNTESGAVSTVVDRTFADNLPLNGRSFQTLILLTPGTVVTQTTFDDQGQFSINGQRADGNYFTVDGASANFGVTGYAALVQSGGGALPALSVSGGTNSLVSVEAMQEFRVQTSSFAPEFGRTPGGQISIVTRSGTNAFHGALFEYLRNDVLDANNWFNGYTNHPALPKAEERQNDFGGALGGPILKGRTFFFFSYEGLRLRQPSTLLTVVPDGSSRQQAPAAMQPYLAAYPVSNGSELGGGAAQFNASFSNPSSLDAFSIRIDHQLGSRWSLFGRLDDSPSSLTQRAPNQGYEPNLATTESESAAVRTLTLGLSAAFTPHIGNEARANLSNDRIATRFAMDNFGGAQPLADSVLFPPGFSSANGDFGLEIVGVGELLQGRFATDEQRQINLVDNLSLTKGSHAMKFGVDYRWLAPFSDIFAYRQFTEFTGLSAGSGGALSGTAAIAAAIGYQPDALLADNSSLYAQDTWHVSPRLTMNYGLRWEINPALKGKDLENQPFTVTGLNNPATMTLAPRGTPLYPTAYGNVAPRVGLAYQVHTTADLQTILRGGLGIFYDLGYGSLGGVSSYFPFSSERIISPAPFPLSPANAAPLPFSTSPPVATILVAAPDFKTPRTYEWNLALEQSFGAAQTISFTYVGAAGRDLLRSTYLYNPNPSFQFVNVSSNTATSDYNALQVKFERRLSHGLQALGSYTWSHSLDIASTDAFANYLSSAASLGSPNIDRGDSDFDIRNSLTAAITYSLPSPRFDDASRMVLGGWSLDAFVLARSAPPVDLIGNISYAAGTAIYPRPNVVPGVPLELYSSRYPGGKIFNAAAFTAPPAGQQGSFGRNVLRDFSAAQEDLALQRQFHLEKLAQLRFRGEFFNLFNHPNFGPPDNKITDALFGHSTGMLANGLGSGGANGGLNPLYQVGGPRSIQLALKVEF